MHAYISRQAQSGSTVWLVASQCPGLIPFGVPLQKRKYIDSDNTLITVVARLRAGIQVQGNEVNNLPCVESVWCHLSSSLLRYRRMILRYLNCKSHGFTPLSVPVGTIGCFRACAHCFFSHSEAEGRRSFFLQPSLFN